MNTRALLALVPLLATGACGDSDSICEIPTTIDIAGTYQERYNCDEAGMCVDVDVPATLIINQGTPGEGTARIYTFRDASDGWMGTGTLCGLVFRWTASEADYSETGVWTFIDANNFTKDSSYRYTSAQGGGVCTGTGSKNQQPPKPPAIGGCP